MLNYDNVDCSIELPTRLESVLKERNEIEVTGIEASFPNGMPQFELLITPGHENPLSWEDLEGLIEDRTGCDLLSERSDYMIDGVLAVGIQHW
jgi:hypothetical protein